MNSQWVWPKRATAFLGFITALLSFRSWLEPLVVAMSHQQYRIFLVVYMTCLFLLTAFAAFAYIEHRDRHAQHRQLCEDFASLMTELGVEGDGNDVEIGAREKVLEGKLPLLHRLSKYFGFNIPAASKSEDTDPQ